jgi:hypothetical protein
MKTPREILMARHQSASPKLDDLRKTVVGRLDDQTAKERSSLFVSLCLCCLKNMWRELILPSRRLWAGLAAIWLIIAAANVSLHDHSSTAMASASPQVIMSLPQEERLLAELSGPGEPAVAEPQKPYTPRPSSRRALDIIIT